MQLNIAFIYADLMNIYGDRGNIIVLKQRCNWRGIEVTVDNPTVGDVLDTDKYDLYFFGGGQDQQQVAVSADLMKDGKGQRLRAALDDGAASLSICGGYQLLGHYYQPHNGEKLPGIGFFNAISKAEADRYIGNVVVESEMFGTLVGFENHSARTYLQDESNRPLGRIVVGKGNNGQDRLEGAVFKSSIGCYLHGSVLPKNPQIADWLIERALQRKYGSHVQLPPLDDSIEQSAAAAAVVRAKQTK